MSSGALRGIRYRRGKTVLDSGSRGFGFAFNMRLLKFISMFEEIRMHRLPALLLIVASAVPADAQTLNAIRNQVREPAGSSRIAAAPASLSKREKQSPRSGHSVSCDDDDGLNELVGGLVGTVLVAAAATPFVVPRAALRDEGARGYFPDYPYDANAGSLVYDSAPPGVHNSLIVLQTDYGADFDSLNQAHGRIFGDIGQRLGFDSEVYYRHENVPSGNDELWQGDVNLTYRFAQNEFWQFRAGLGVNWLADKFGTDAGFNTTYGVEWFPKDPLVLSSTIDWGRIGDSSVFHFRNTVGVTHNGWGIFTGHDYQSVGGVKINAWVNGIEYRF